MSLTVLDPTTFDSFPAQHSAAVIYVWTPSCVPCRSVGPIVERLALRYEGQVAFGKFDAELPEHRIKVVGFLGTLAVPQLHFFKSGKREGHLTGARSEESLDRRVRELL